MLAPILLACTTDPRPARPLSGPEPPDRARYAGCVEDFRSTDDSVTTTYDDLGWPLASERRSGDRVVQVDAYEGRNAYGLFARWTSELVGVAVETVVGAYDGGRWTTREVWFDDELHERWTYAETSDREQTAAIDESGDGSVDLTWLLSTRADGRPLREATASVDGGTRSEQTWQYDGDREVLTTFEAADDGGYTLRSTWGSAPAPERVSAMYTDANGEVYLTIDARYTFDEAGRELTAAVELAQVGAVLETQDWVWTWDCP